jgi:hypothetical protein
MNGYLLLEFDNAGLFNINNNSHYKIECKDYVNDINGSNKRNLNYKKFKEPITIYHIYNMLCVLFGERPKPSLRNTYSCLYRIDYIMNIAKKCKLKINDYKYSYINKDNKNIDVYFNELIKTKKSVHNSFSTNDFVYWERIKHFLDNEELYSELLNVCRILLNINPLKYTFIEICKLLKNNHLDNILLQNFLVKLKKYKKTPLILIIVNNNFSTHYMNKNDKVKITNLNGVDKNFIKLSGEILVPIDDFISDKINNGKGCATILDSGIVRIKKKIFIDNYNENDFINDGFINVEDISEEIIIFN